MKTNIETFKTNSYYLAANASAFLDEIKENPNFREFLANEALKQLPDGASLHLSLDEPYSLYIDRFDKGLESVQVLSEKLLDLNVESVDFYESEEDLFAKVYIKVFVEDAAFTYDYLGKLHSPEKDDTAWSSISFVIRFEVRLPSSTPVSNLPAYEFFNVGIESARVEKVETVKTAAKEELVDIDLAKYIYEHLGGDVDSKGNFTYDAEDVYTYEDIHDYYSPRISKEVYDATLKALLDGLEKLKFYDGNIELSDRHIAWELNANIDDEEYWTLADQYSEKFDKEFNVKSGYDGRSARHYVVDPTVENILRYEDLKDGVKRYQDEFISYINTNYAAKEAVTEEVEPIPAADIAPATLIGDLIKDEWEAIQGYETAINILSHSTVTPEQTKVLVDIRDEEYRHVGQLQELLQSLTDGVDNIEKGEQEGEEQIFTATESTEYPGSDLMFKEVEVKDAWGNSVKGRVDGIGTGEFTGKVHVKTFKPTGYQDNFYKVEDVKLTDYAKGFEATAEEALRKPKYYDTMFGEQVRKDYDNGKLTYENVAEWDKKQNGGVAPKPAFNTKEILDYYIAHQSKQIGNATECNNSIRPVFKRKK